MPLLTWTTANSVGISEIDEQHKIVFGIINNLYEAIKTLKDKEKINAIISELENYALFHFGTEEKYFESFNYQDQKEHEAYHEDFRMKIKQFKEDYQTQASFISFEILDYLENWWIGHINHEDKKYTRCFQEHGLT